MAVFGRDSLLTAYMSLIADPELALGVLQTLARFQGTKVDAQTEEQPGRIVHEYWNPIPQKMILARWPVANGEGRYYGAFDATFLYLIAFVEGVFVAGVIASTAIATADRKSEMSKTERTSVVPDAPRQRCVSLVFIGYLSR